MGVVGGGAAALVATFLLSPGTREPVAPPTSAEAAPGEAAVDFGEELPVVSVAPAEDTYSRPQLLLPETRTGPDVGAAPDVAGAPPSDLVSPTPEAEPPQPLERIRGLIARGELAEAARKLNEIPAAERETEAVLAVAALLAVEAGQTDLARAAYARLVRMDPDEPRYRQELAKLEVPAAGSDQISTGEAKPTPLSGWPTGKCDDGNSDPWDGCVEGRLTEFLVARLPTAQPRHVVTARVAVSPEGSFAVFWGQEQVKARFFNPDGLGGDTVDVSGENMRALYPDAAFLSSERAVAVWHAREQVHGRFEIFAQLIDGAGVKVGARFRVNSTTRLAQTYPRLAPLPDGSFFVAWASNGQGEQGEDVFGRYFEMTGKSISDEFRVNEFADGDQSIPVATALTDGKVVVVWSGKGPIREHGTRLRIIGQDRTPVGEDIRTNIRTEKTQVRPDVGGLANGGFVIVWFGSRKGRGLGAAIFAQVYDGAGDRIGGTVTVTEEHWQQCWFPSVAGLSDGGFVVSWSGDRGRDLPDVVTVRLLSDRSLPFGSEIRLSGFPAAVRSDVHLASYPGGGFVATWGAPKGTHYPAVFARRFDTDGYPVHR